MIIIVLSFIAWEKAEVDKKWEGSGFYKRIQLRKKRASLSDFDRFKVKNLKYQVNYLLNIIQCDLLFLLMFRETVSSEEKLNKSNENNNKRNNRLHFTWNLKINLIMKKKNEIKKDYL